MAETGYPVRERFFSQRFHRLMAKLCLAQDVGVMGYALLSVIVSQEDACRYRKAVTYYDTQLMPLIGCSSAAKIVKTRKLLVNLGWLHFEAGRKGVPSTYWATIPARFEEVEDTGVGEHLNNIHSIREVNQECIRSESGVHQERIGSASEAHQEHSLPLTLNPISLEAFGAKPTTVETQAARLAQEFRFYLSSGFGPTLHDLTEHFRGKLTWLKGIGRDEYDFILERIQDKSRDPTSIATINQMFIFWRHCEEHSNGRDFGGLGKKQANHPAPKRSVPGGDAYGDSEKYAGKKRSVLRFDAPDAHPTGPDVPAIQTLESARAGNHSGIQRHAEPAMDASQASSREDLSGRGNGAPMRSQVDGEDRHGDSDCLGLPSSAPGGSVHARSRPAQRPSHGLQHQLARDSGNGEALPALASPDSG